jgi:hypothetical protein
MVWHTTTHVGMAKAKSASGTVFVVARYWPSGNVRGAEPFPGAVKLHEEKAAAERKKAKWRKAFGTLFG